MILDFITLDVFTTVPYEGNPLAIVRIPSALRSAVTQAHKQTIATEFNLSESIFVHESSSSGEWEADIFTTEAELPFAGHPTIGAAYYLFNLASSPPASGKLITKAGSIDIETTSSGRVSANIPHDVHIHRHTIGDLIDPGTGFSANARIAAAESAAPLVSIVHGMTFLLVPLPSIELLAEVQVESGGLSFSHMLDQGWTESFVARYYYARGEGGEIRSRMVEETMEDPATGSAACALASYLALMSERDEAGEEHSFVVTQGVEMGRRSVIGVDVVMEGKGKIATVKLSGSAVQIMEGKIRI